MPDDVELGPPQLGLHLTMLSDDIILSGLGVDKLKKLVNTIKI